MRYVQLFLIIILITACSGTKKVVENQKKDVEEPKKTKDSIVKIIADKPEESTTITPSKTLIKNDTIAVLNASFNHSTWNNLLQKYVSKQGHVNYKALKNNRKELLNYITLLSKNKPTDSWSKEDKLAYWINAYNAMTIDLILRHYPIKSIKAIEKPWQQRFWKLGAKWYNLDEIEHQILRKMDEPRIHFAIVCASYSCPKLQNQAFTALKIEEQLTQATKEFLSDSERNSISENEIQLSRIFQWFSKDFKQNGSLIGFLNQYSDIEISTKAKKTFKDYNWDLNE